MPGRRITRRRLLCDGIKAAALIAIVPRCVLGAGETPPSDILTRAVIGTGGRGGAFVRDGSNSRMLAGCDVDTTRIRTTPGADRYTDFRRVLDRRDIDVVYIGTPPHWHALITIEAMKSGKDVYCEKPMTRFIAEGRAVVEAATRYNRIFQIGTFGRFGSDRKLRKLMASGLLGPNVNCTWVRRGGFKVRQWSGRTDLVPQPVPPNLDYDLWLGPAPYKPYHPHRVHGSFRGYWDYDGGGLADMGQHHLDRIHYDLNRDHTSPVEIEAHAPWPAHPDACGMWGWCKLKYADGVTIVLESDEWDQPSGLTTRTPSESDLDDEGRKLLAQLPDPEPMIGNEQWGFEDAVRQRRQCGGHPEAAHRTCCLLHLTNIAIRLGRTLTYDPDKEQFVDDDEANRFVNVPMRAPWHL